MTGAEPSFTIGIEEEYLLVDRKSRDVVTDPPQEIFAECKRFASAGLVEPELLRSQIEVGTRVRSSGREARQELAGLFTLSY